MPKRLGGDVTLDFINTVEPRNNRRSPVDYLNCYTDIIEWGIYVKILDPTEAEILIQMAAASYQKAISSFNSAIELREALYRIFSAIARSDNPAEQDLEKLKMIYCRALENSRIVKRENCFIWQQPDSASFDLVSWQVVRSAVNLLIVKEIKRIKECPTVEGCGWLFYDSSRNGRRNWCSMRGCGSRAKMRRLYSRKQIQ